MLTIRRLVTAQTPDGRGVFATVQELEARPTPGGLFGIWGWDETPTLPFVPRGDFPAMSALPAIGGLRVNAVAFPPGFGNATPGDAYSGETFKRVVADGPELLEAEPGMHRTDTVDICVVISGEVCVRLDGGEEHVLRPGDVLLQMGTPHVWSNRTSNPCVVACVVLGVEREPDA